MSDPQSARGVADQEAADWHVRLGERPVSIETLRAFAVWREAPANAEAYRRIETLWRQSGALSGDADIRAVTGEVLRTSRKRPRRSGRSRLVPVLAALALLLAGGAALAIWIPNRGLYVTGVGEQRVVQLQDGSRLRLDTDTRLRVVLNGGERRILLEQGQARFEVAHDPARPFRVLAGATEVTALGTVFDVRRASDGARVTLVEGSVAVTHSTPGEGGAWRLAPGQRVRTDRRDARPEPVDAAVVEGWAQGQLVFRGVPLGEAVDEVNRYLPQKIVLPAGAPRSTPISGVFAAGDGPAFRAAVSDLFDLDLRTDPKGPVEAGRPSAEK